MATRKILAIIIALTLVLGIIVCISGCSNPEEVELTESEIGGLVAISHQYHSVDGNYMHKYIFYDPDTLVMYAMINTREGIAMSVLYNADGTPKLYDPENN